MTRTRVIVGIGLLLALVIGGVVSYYASTAPDGLERVATDQGFLSSEEEHATSGWWFADYGTAGVENERVSVGVAGVVGVAVTLGLGTATAYGLRRRQAKGSTAPDGSGG